MGEARRLEKFLIDHPVCCYCGGKSETVDHNPARSFFPEGAWPAGFTFPACRICNHGKSADESRAALVLSSFNLMDPEEGAHREATTKRLEAFLNRDMELRSTIAQQFPGPLATYSQKPFAMPMKYKLSVLRVGLTIFQAIHYRLTGEPCDANQNVMVRFATNAVEADEREYIEDFVSQLNQETPPPAKGGAITRFNLGHRKLDGGYVLAAEFPGSTTWYGFILAGEPPTDVADRFDWFKGDGRFHRSTLADEQGNESGLIRRER